MVGEYEREVFHSSFQKLKSIVQELGLANRVIFTGYLADDDLVILLNLATVLVLPSLMEGFGLPAIEAAACGCPVIATKASPLPGLLGEGGLYIDPAKRNDLELALEACAESERAASADACSRSRRPPRRLTWDAAARQMINVMQKVVTQ